MMQKGPFYCYLTLLAQASSARTLPNYENIASVSTGSLFGRADYFMEDDLSSIKRIAAIGDSYSAGIGAGNLLDGDAGSLLSA